MSKNVGNHYGFAREWILLVISVMNSISVDRSIPFHELINYPEIREEILDLTKRVSSRPNRNYSTKPEDVVMLMEQLKIHPDFLILHP